MTKRQLTIIGAVLILTQIVLFRNYLPFLSNQLIVKGISCTCPDAEVKNGASYLKSITPDSLKQYNLNYSEIYFENRISTVSDPMGINQYIVTGEVVGKRRISKGVGDYYPVFRIDSYSDKFVHSTIKWIIRGLILTELMIFFILIRRKRNEL